MDFVNSYSLDSDLLVDSAIYLLNNLDQDCKDGSGLQFIKFDVVTGDQEIKVSILVEF